MPAYQVPFQVAGGLLGGAAGGGIGGLLGQVGDTLSAPRRALWGAAGLPDSGSEVLHQYAGMDPSSPWTKALGMGVEMAGDPLTYAGFAAGAVPGLLGGRALGEGLEAAALARGPQYAGGLEKLTAAMPQIASSGEGAILYRHLVDNPQIGRALQELPPASKLLANGVEGAVFDTGEGDVARIGTSRMNPSLEVPTQRPRAPGVVPVTRDVPLPSPADGQWGGGLRVERMPRATALYRPFDPKAMEPIMALRQQLGSQGLDFYDAHAGNVARFGEAGDLAIDGVGWAPGSSAPTETMPPPVAGWQNWLLDRLGASRTVQQELAAKARQPISSLLNR